ncbi:DUF3397 domain-containing protein [Gracilibacillus sp. YIM 98692]|uniref:DUF3397 domain-containing protein n=1 Tax=Gracilibacillus sp. YIM 98692 TaxID=2663532 RepID=UPI0013D058AC|nr:DUF3397 domain-containing protein [Gracilibacillus sp. YIM 98692]
MLHFLSSIVAFMVTVPLLITFVVYKVSYYFFQNKWKSIHIAVDVTVILYIFSVGTIGFLLFSSLFITFIIIFVLCIWVMIVLIQWRWGKEIEFRIVWKRFWKACFLVFVVLHLILVCYGIAVYVIDIV